MLINLSELFTCEGKRKVYTVSFELGSIEFGGDIYKIVKAEPFELEIANIGGGKKYTMSGGLSVTVEAPCARCLEPVTFVCELVFDRELDLGKKEEQEDSLDEEPYLSGYSLDVDQLVCNELLLSLTAKGFAIDVEQISILGLVPVTLGRSIHGCQLSRRFLINLRRCNHVYMSKEQIFQSKKRQPQG